ncbi:MAG: SH3 domain-containing protein [Pseudomonadota bacterium]
MMKRKYLALACAAAIPLSGCQTTPEQARLMRNIGCAGVGIGFGALVSSKTGASDLGAAASGLAAGALCAGLANLWVKELEKRDQEQLALATQEAAISDQPQTFTSDTGVKAKVTVEPATPAPNQKTAQVKVLKDKVEQTPPLTVVNKPYSANSRVNVRSGPGTDYKVVGAVNAGEVRQVVGKVNNAPWFMVAEGGAGSGYVYSSLLTPSAQEAPKLTASGPVNVVDVPLQCKTVKQEVTLAGDSEATVKELKICQDKNGAWQSA